MPPWIHSESGCEAMSACSGVSSIVAAPSICVARVLTLIVQEGRRLLRHERGRERPRHNRERPPRPGDRPRLVPGAERERPVGKRRAVRLLRRLDGRIDRLATRVDGVLTEILQALLDVVPGEIRHHVRILGADPGHDRQQLRRRLVRSVRRTRDARPRRPWTTPLASNGPAPSEVRPRSQPTTPRPRAARRRAPPRDTSTASRPCGTPSRPSHDRTTLTSYTHAGNSCAAGAH